MNKPMVTWFSGITTGVILTVLWFLGFNFVPRTVGENELPNTGYIYFTKGNSVNYTEGYGSHRVFEGIPEGKYYFDFPENPIDSNLMFLHKANGEPFTTTIKWKGFSWENTRPIKKYYGTMLATAYEPSPRSCGRWAKYHKTATGIRPHKGVIAVDPKVIKLHTKLYVEGYGWGYAEDTGSAIKGRHIDLFFPTYAEAIKWGRRKVGVYIYAIQRPGKV